jgi:hypothetical protein
MEQRSVSNFVEDLTMYGKIIVLAAALGMAMPTLALVAPADAASIAGRETDMNDEQRRAIYQAFSEAVPDLGLPEIHAYPGGAYNAEARKGDVVANVKRDIEGQLIASFTVTRGSRATRGTASDDGRGKSELRGIFGELNDKRDAMYAAERLVRVLARPN